MPQSANPLDIRTCITQVQEALVEVLDLAYRYRYPEAADLAALAAREAMPLPDRALIFVAGEGVVYRWRTASTLPPTAPYVIAPNILPPAGNGRWLRESSAVTFGHDYRRPLHRVRTGYARACQIYQGQDEARLAKIYAQRPAYLVEWVGDELKVQAYRHGSLAAYDLRFIVHVLARNLRNGPQALVGSDVATDTEPGLYQMIGDVRYLLGGCRLGLDPGVKFTDVTGAARIIEMIDGDLSQRTFRAEIDIVVRASVHVMDEDLIEAPEVWVDRQDAGTPDGQPFDPGNFVARGYSFGPQPSLSSAPAPGVAYIRGQIVMSTPGAVTFPPSMDTYRDLLPDGSLEYSAVPAGAKPPPQPAKALRVGVTTTSADSIVRDRYLCSYRVPSGVDPGDPFRAA